MEKPCCILLVDDDPQVLSLGRELLELRGYRVQAAADGEEALRLFGCVPRPDLVVCDYDLPGINGREVLGRMKEIDPGVPVLMASGFFETQTAADLMQAGAAGLMEKPYRLTELEARIKKALGQVLPK